MRRTLTTFALATWLCSCNAQADDTGYTPPHPLREAVTARGPATDINDDTVAAATEQKGPAEVAEALSKSPPASAENSPTLEKTEAGASSIASEDDNLSEIVGSSDAAAIEQSAAEQPAPTLPQIDEVAEKPTVPALAQVKVVPFGDIVEEMMGGEFNTEFNQRLAESFLSVRPRMLHLRANRDL